MKIAFIVGARPNFVKLAPIYDIIVNYSVLEPYLIHTGQHYDNNMSKLFFKDLKIPLPDYNLNIGSANHTIQTAEIMLKLEELFQVIKPDHVVVIGDVNSTLAATLVASKNNIKLSHIEAGLRSFNKTMPEEINRIVTDHLCDILFVPSPTGMQNLKNEGLEIKSFFTGDIMYDAVLRNIQIADSNSKILNIMNLNNKRYYLLTLHRPYNVDNKMIITEIFSAIKESDNFFVFPIHPRTKKNILAFNIDLPKNLLIIDPVGYLDFLVLEKNAIKIITDSGGVQKEAYFLKTACITLRSETEWPETIEVGANVLIKSRSKDDILTELVKERKIEFFHNFYGNGQASKIIMELLTEFITR